MKFNLDDYLEKHKDQVAIIRATNEVINQQVHARRVASAPKCATARKKRFSVRYRFDKPPVFA